MPEETKAVVSVSDMARMVGLSRARFYQLQKEGYFPPPERDAESGKPFYTEEQQRVVLEVRRRNFGVNGKKILFYAARRLTAEPARPRPEKVKAPKVDQHREIIEGVETLGLAHVTSAHVDAALKAVFPQGTADTPETDVVKEVFLHLRGRNSGDNVGR